MLRVEEQIAVYNMLVPEERQRVDAYLDAHPEMKPMLDEARDWLALLQEACLLLQPMPGDEALAYFVATARMNRHPLPPRLQAVFARLEARVAAQPELQARVATMTRRLEELEQASDPVAQFEALTGHRR